MRKKVKRSDFIKGMKQVPSTNYKSGQWIEYQFNYKDELTIKELLTNHLNDTDVTFCAVGAGITGIMKNAEYAMDIEYIAQTCLEREPNGGMLGIVE